MKKFTAIILSALCAALVLIGVNTLWALLKVEGVLPYYLSAGFAIAAWKFAYNYLIRKR